MNDVDKLLLDLVLSVAGLPGKDYVVIDVLNPALVRSISYLVKLGLLVIDDSDDVLYRVVSK